MTLDEIERIEQRQRERDAAGWWDAQDILELCRIARIGLGTITERKEAKPSTIPLQPVAVKLDPST